MTLANQTKQSQRHLLVTPAELNACLRAIPKPSKLMAKRDKALIVLLFTSGLRASEASNLTRSQIILGSSGFNVIGKGGHLGRVYIDGQASRLLKSYWTASDKFAGQACDYAMTATTAKRARRSLTSTQINAIVKRAFSRVGLNVSSHCLRHSFISYLINNYCRDTDNVTLALKRVQVLARHKSLETTLRVYSHISDDDVANFRQGISFNVC